MHLHGHNFWVVRSAGNATYNWDNPIVRDVVYIGDHDATGNVTIRVQTSEYDALTTQYVFVLLHELTELEAQELAG